MPTTDTTGTGARRARLHGALDRLLDCRGGDGVLGQVESAVKRAAPSVTGALTTEPGSIGDARRKRLHASLDRLLDSGQEWMDREAEAYSRKADASGRPEDHKMAARLCTAAAEALAKEGEPERARHFKELADAHMRKSSAKATDAAGDCNASLQRAYDAARKR